MVDRACCRLAARCAWISAHFTGIIRFLVGSVWVSGKIAIAGMPNFRAAVISFISTSRFTPGIEATGVTSLEPGCTNTGQIKSAGDNVFSVTMWRETKWSVSDDFQENWAWL